VARRRNDTKENTVSTETVNESNDVDLDVDTSAEEDGVVESTEATAEKAPKAKKEPVRGELHEGYVTPVGLAKVITEKGLHTNREGAVTTLAPQMVYSYIKNAPKEDPFPFEEGYKDQSDKPRQAAKLEDALAWWDRKRVRAGERKANAAAKASKKAEKPATEGNTEDAAPSEAVEAE
jgi:hypothetical protein